MTAGGVADAGDEVSEAIHERGDSVVSHIRAVDGNQLEGRKGRHRGGGGADDWRLCRRGIVSRSFASSGGVVLLWWSGFVTRNGGRE